MKGGLALLWVLAALPGLSSQAGASPALTEAPVKPCIMKTTKFLPLMTNVSGTVQVSAQACQVSCALTQGCVFFTYNSETKGCSYALAGAEPEADWRMEGGYGICPAPPSAKPDRCTTELPKDGFPGLDARGSNESWPLGSQPRSLECWEKDANDEPMQCELVTVIEDSAFGWPGKCLGFTLQAGVPVTACDTHCSGMPTCQAYQTTGEECYVGLGEDCYTRSSAPAWAPTKAQRFQHGTVRKLMDLKGWQILGLSKVFSSKADGYFVNHTNAADHCKLACYSDIGCQYWSYSTQYGCWVEDVSKFRVEYPLTTAHMTRDSVFAQTAIGGEYIQHICQAELATAIAPEVYPMPFCALSGYRLEPLDMNEGFPKLMDNADLCQKECFQTSDCSYFSFVAATGECHLQGSMSTMVYDPAYISGPQECPVATAAPQATCGLHAACVAQGFEGLCCPNAENVIMGCCDSILSGAEGSIADEHIIFRGGVGATAAREPPVALGPSTGRQRPSWDHPLMLLLVTILCCACCLAAAWKPCSRKQARASDLEDPLGAAVSHLEHSLGQETPTSQLEMDPLMHPEDGGRRGGEIFDLRLPFPEAGLANRSNLPFPEVGLRRQP